MEKIKLKASEVLDSNPAFVLLKNLDGRNGGKKLPYKVGYTLARIERILEAEWKTLEEKRQGLLQQFAEKDDKGNLIPLPNNQIKLTIEGRKEYPKAWGEILESEIEIVVPKIPNSLLESLELEYAIVYSLTPFIKEDKPAPAATPPAPALPPAG